MTQETYSHITKIVISDSKDTYSHITKIVISDSTLNKKTYLSVYNPFLEYPLHRRKYLGGKGDMCPLPHFLENKIGSTCNLSMKAQNVQLIKIFKNVCLEAKLSFYIAL